MVADMRSRMSLFAAGLSHQLRDSEEFKNKRAKTSGNESGQQKSNANRSSFQHKQKGPAPSSASAPAPRNKCEYNSQNSQNFRARLAHSQGRKAQWGTKTSACANYGRSHSGMCRDGSTTCFKGRILEVLKSWPERNIQVIVITDGERILGLGDLDCSLRVQKGVHLNGVKPWSNEIGYTSREMALYTALGGVRPSAVPKLVKTYILYYNFVTMNILSFCSNVRCLPITIDVGTNNEQLLKDKFYIRLRQKRATGKEYYDFLDEFMKVVKINYGEKVLAQYDDFANHNAFELLAKYGTTHLVFNDDIQAGTGIGELIALVISKKINVPVEEARKNIWLVDSKGLIVNARKESLQAHKKPWAYEHEPVNNLLDIVKAIKPAAIIGTSGVGRTFTKEVIEVMASINKRPFIMALSNPTTQSECTTEEAYTWSEGRAIFASGSLFPSVEYNNKLHIPSQANNCYIFPRFGFGLVMIGAICVHNDMLLAACKWQMGELGQIWTSQSPPQPPNVSHPPLINFCLRETTEALASQVTEEHYGKGIIYPPFGNIRKISAYIVAKAYELGVATRLPQPANLVKYVENCMYTLNYHSYR
ncbi:hypothetical protein MTR67_007756 [Solanum verrucosum]|uniref:Malic enzyme n=1 Tax=Solanum verrucosum TaxID=315347 RepID=A0AAF0Q0F2_SOLVR|nr:hypothetical protein MTR67_007756 [Solanum verrucosum]